MSDTTRAKQFRKDKREAGICKLRNKVVNKFYNRQKEKRVKED